MRLGVWRTYVLAFSILGMFTVSGKLVSPIEGSLTMSQCQWDNRECIDRIVQQITAEQRLEEQKRQEEQKAVEKQKQDYLEQYIDRMSLEEKLAQMMIMTHEKDMVPISVERNQPGGIIFFGFDFYGKTTQQVRNRVDDVQAVSKIPMLICVDEEGGSINRVSGLKDERNHLFESARSLGQTLDREFIKEQTSQKSQLLSEMGINVNFDPVADITVNPRSYMFERSAGPDADTVSLYVEAVVEQMKQDNMISCLKHFPGYGENGNTHVDYILDKRTMDEYKDIHFIPFQTGIQAGTDMVMVSHLVMHSFNKKMPASLSKSVHQYIREEMQFDGVIIADDLNMQAVLSRMDLAEASAKAVEAGNDMLFSADIDQSMAGIQKALRQGTVTEEQIDASVYRILNMKYEHQMITRSEE